MSHSNKPFIKVLLPIRNRLVHADIIPTARWVSTFKRLDGLLGHHLVHFLHAHQDQHPTIAELLRIAEQAWDTDAYHVLADIASKIQIIK